MSAPQQSGASRVSEFLRTARTVDLEVVEVVATQEEVDQLGNSLPIRPNAVLVNGQPLLIPKGLPPKIHEVVVDGEEVVAVTMTFWTRSTYLGVRLLDDLIARTSIEDSPDVTPEAQS